jgi:hypothetical protein
MTKIIVHLHDHESAALHELAAREYRSAKAQAALIIRRELQRLELIPIDPAAAALQTTTSEED